MNLKKLTASILALLIFAPTVFANGNVSITRSEPDPNSKNNTWFIFESSAGNTIEDTVLVKNLSQAPIKVKIQAVDTKPNKAGRFILKDNSEPQNEIGNWTNINDQILELGPQEVLPVNFNIQLPPELAPGEYTGGIVVEEVNETESQGSLISTRIGNRVYLTIPGHVKHNLNWLAFDNNKPGFNIFKVFNKPHYFKFDIENNGNTIIKPTVEIEIYNLFRSKIDTIEKQLGEFQPNSQSQPIIKWDNARMFGRFTAKAIIKFDKEENATQQIIKEINILIIPWELITIIIILLVLGLIFIVLRKPRNAKKDS